MDENTLCTTVMMVVMGVLGIFTGIVMATESADNRVVNQLCQKQQYDFCEISGYKMKGDLK